MKAFTLDAFDTPPSLRDDLPEPDAGSWATHIAVAEAAASAAPAGLSLAEAGAAPLAGVTAMKAIDALGLSEGETLVIVGAAGGVGSFAVQLAKRAGARVVAPALPEDEDHLGDLGVDEIVERGGSPPEADAVLDLVSYSPDQVPAAGRVASPLGAAGDGPGRFNVMASADPDTVALLTALLEDGLRVPIQRSYALEGAGDAMADLAGQHTQGKIAIEIR
jgi:NADPH:quinone reductase